MFEAGAVVGGRYLLIEPLGEGGMGTVWAAENTAIKGSRVAVKVLHRTYARDPQVVRRFRAEAEASARVGHPGIIKVFDFGETDDGVPWMVMERLDGESLADRLSREGRLAPEEAVGVVCAALDALSAAHDKGVVHRDLKPENLFLAREGDAVVTKVLDFGVSKFLGDDAERVRLTRTGAVLGTPAYMSPEQARGAETVDHRSDLWAMGVILYELLAGALPFDAANYNALLIAIATGEAKPLSDAAPEVDLNLVDIVERAMARQARDRYASATAMRDALIAWRGAPRDTAPPRRVSVPLSDRPTPMGFEHADTLVDAASLAPPAPTRSRRWVLPAVVAAVAGVLALGTRAVTTPTTPRAEAHAPRAPSLAITGLPPMARVTVDDAPVFLPARLRGEGAHRVRVSAPGWREWMQVVPRAEGDVTLAYTGERDAPVVEPTTAVEQRATAVERHPTSTSGVSARPRRPPRRSGPTTPPRGEALLVRELPE
ncbi:MAG: serine/threonine-protein kinase [Polyangiales bacterium]